VLKLDKESHIVGKFYREVEHANDQYFEFWLTNTFLQWEWWLSLALAIIPWIIWVKLIDKNKRARYLFAGFFIMIISSWLDFFGVVFGLWYYTGKLLPTIPSFIPWDLSLIPTTMTLMMHCKPSFSPLIKALIYGALVAFIGETLFDWLGFYRMVRWEHVYSFPIFVLIYLVADSLTKRKSFEMVDQK
jgi:hypothetical protein